MTDKPVSETVITILYVLQLFFLGNALNISISGFAGWGDVIAIIFLMSQWLAVLITLPFLSRALKRSGIFGWFDTLIKIFIGLPVLLTIIILFVLQSHDVGTPVLTLVAVGINILPAVLFYTYKNNNQTVFKTAEE